MMRKSIWGGILGACVMASAAAAGDNVLLGEAIALTAAEMEALGAVKAGGALRVATSGDVAGFSVDTDDRLAVAELYHCVYLASEGFEGRMGWAGDVASCAEGTVSSSFHDDTLRRINYYRAMAGLNADIVFSATKNAKCQKAALIMSRNGALSHDPIGEHPEWSCLTTDGDEAAGCANISMSTGASYTGPRSVDGQMADLGSSNIPVGHRRWLLYPRAREMGNGGIPGQGSYGSSAAVWVIGDFGAAPASPVWVGWPNRGYVPYMLVPARWSLSMAGANFNNATVSMTHDGAPVTLTKIHPTTSSPAVGYGDPTIVWEPQGVPTTAPACDETYVVTISGITGAASSTVTYTVTLMDPYDMGQEAALTGPGRPFVGQANAYGISPVAGATAYEVRFRKAVSTNWTEGAESSPVPRILDETSTDYSLIQSALVRSGSKAFQMAFPSFTDQSFEIDRTIVPSATSQLSFHFRRRFSHSNNRITAELSSDDGATWSSLWNTNGLCSGSCGASRWDPAWLPVNIGLAGYADRAVRLRLKFAHNGNIYRGTTSSYGVFVDDVHVTDAEEITSVTVTNVPAGAAGFSFTPDSMSRYLIDTRVQVGCHWFDGGSLTSVLAVPVIRVVQVRPSGSSLAVRFSVSGGAYSGYVLRRCAGLGGEWVADDAAVFDPARMEFTTAMDSARPLFRVDGAFPCR